MLDLSLKDKLAICYGVLFPKELFSYRDKKNLIFNKGYRAGLKDTKRPGLYKVTTNYCSTGKVEEFEFDDIQEALDFIEQFYDSSTGKRDSCDFVQTYLDRDLEYLIP